ncbi:MAG TPA: hypothetical protein VLH37_02680 [Bacteroidales bacterium]|nr:hypothetical protein [Bacteroidales bacterium]
MKMKVLSFALALAMTTLSLNLGAGSRQWSICTQETINCFNENLEPVGGAMVMACGDTWQEWRAMMNDYAEIFCGHSAWGF